jgi:hypothetical protein
MSAQFSSVKSYPVSVANSDVPSAWLSNADPRVAGATKKILSVSSQNGTQTSGGQLSFILPSNMGAGFLASGSAYLKFTVTVTQAVATAWAFRQYGSGSSVINRMTLLASGAITEQILNYNKLYSSLMLHASNPNFVQADDKINQFTLPGAFSTTLTSTVCVPILLGAFNSKQHLPLFLLNSAQLNVDLDTVANAITYSTNAVTEYSISSATLVCEQICPDHQFEAGIKSMLGQRLFQMPINTYYNVRVAQTGAVTQNIGLNCSSLRSVLWNTVVREAGADAGHFTDGGQTSCRLYLDGQLVFNGNLSDSVQQFIEMNRSLNTMWDSDRVSVGVVADTQAVAVANDFTYAALTRAIYSSGAYLGGLSTAKSSDGGFSFQGVPCNTAVLEFVGTNAGTFYIYCALQQIIAIDSQGNASLIR